MTTETKQPWLAEPDELTGSFGDIPWTIKRVPHIGHLCGYVGILPGHPWWGKSYGDEIIDNIPVHGGITYGGDTGEWPIEGFWWVGFDCAHAGDFIPAVDTDRSVPSMLGGGNEYRDINYVQLECEGLAARAAEASL